VGKPAFTPANPRHQLSKRANALGYYFIRAGMTVADDLTEGVVMQVSMESDLGNLQLDRKSLVNFAWLKRAVVALVGFTVLFVGIAMMVLPGPAVVVIPLGLAILATEFLWAQRLLERARATLTGHKGEQKPILLR
jgi:tellurite resistance protein TerC